MIIITNLQKENDLQMAEIEKRDLELKRETERLENETEKLEASKRNNADSLMKFEEIVNHPLFQSLDLSETIKSLNEILEQEAQRKAQLSKGTSNGTSNRTSNGNGNGMNAARIGRKRKGLGEFVVDPNAVFRDTVFRDTAFRDTDRSKRPRRK